MTVAATLAIRGGESAEVLIEGDRIVDAASGSPAASTLDAAGCRTFPGFVDLQCNGGFGIDFTTSPERADEVAARLPETGVTSFLPTVITAPPAAMLRALTALEALRDSSPGARSLGVHLEGPFINPSRGGAHPRQHIRLPDRAEAAHWLAVGGLAMVTLAPELDGALDLIADLAVHGVVVSCGHCEVSPLHLRDAVSAGATAATHLFNAMGSMSARSPGSAGAVLAETALTAGIIVDGVHVDPTMVAVAWRAMGAGRLVLVTDAMAALGLGHGSFTVGDTDVHVDEHGPRTADGVLAGSVLRMDEAVRNLVAFTGCSTADAVAAASTTPARVVGRTDVGVLSTGAFADVVLLDADDRVAATVVGGRVLFDPDHRLSS
jgi:N-acetylglucosamine-6-phosphate deacetylase